MNEKNHEDKTSAVGRSPAEASLADRVYAHISEQILSGRWVSGDIVNRKEIATKLDVSLAPVNEALIRLTHEEFLETKPNRHTRVRIVRKEDVRDQLVLRIALERQAVSMVHGERVRRAKARLLSLAEEVDNFTSGDSASWPAEIAFHQALVDLAECRSLSAAYEPVIRRHCFIGANSSRMSNFYLSPGRMQHAEYVEALTTDDPAEADAAILGHYKSYRDVLAENDHFLGPITNNV